MIGVSPDSPSSHREFIAKYKLTIELLSDPEHETMEKYRAWGEKNNYGKISMGVLRTTYLIGPDGKVAKRWDKVAVEGHAEAVLAAILTCRT